jgi:hypothetical protein
MFVIQSILIFDMAAMVTMLSLLALSKRIGEALKIPKWYRVLFFTTLMTFVASSIDAFHDSFADPVFGITAMTLRVAAAVIAFIACLPYWNWLFSEYFFKQG